MSNVVNENPSEKITKILSHVSYSEVATKLLYDKFLLTALELHTELVESGRELPILKEFFSNPGNFEHQSRPDVSLPISRSGSQATLDSLDLTRYSEDGERGVDERVAVLEFELRKAKETISALRANLTVATESETTKPDAKALKPNSSDIIKPHEQRALNFLINEYLLSHGYKLTSITFSDENENQDFEDWDDVGLNIPKPSELLFLYREALKVIGFNSVSTECQTEISNIDEEKDKMLLYLNSEINNYKSLIDTLETDKQELQKQYENLIAQQNQALVSHSSTTELLNSALENETISTNSTSPERFEIIDKPGRSLKIKGGNSLITSEDDESANSLNNPDMDWTKVTIALDTARNIQKQNSEHDSCSLKSEPINIVNIHSNRNLPVTYQKELFSQCFKNISTKSDNTILDDLLKEDITCERLVNTVTVCLPRIIPNVILNKREEVIPLLLSAVHLNPSSAERDKLLQQLFNLKKRPTEEERPKILAGLIGIAQIAGVNLVENELLPLCWEQISHKYTERRLLVIETCICLAPYISSTIRNSLMLSILQQMLTEEKEPSVRELSVQALALVVGLCDDPDKYSACEELALYALSDTDSSVVSVCNNLLLPVLAKLALDLDKFQTIFMKKLFKKLRQLITRTEILAEEKVVHVITAFNILIPFTLISVVSADAVINKIDQDTKSIQLRTEFLKLCSPLSNPQNFYEGDIHIGNLIASFQTMMSEEKCSSWPQLDWLLDTMLQELLGITNHIEVTQESLLQSTINLFRNISISFGKQFTKWKLKRLFESHIQNLEISLANFNVNHSSPKLSLIPVYLIGILNSVEYAEEISSLVKRLTCALSLSGTSLYSLEISVKGLSENKDLQASIVAALWDNVVHQRPVVRSSTASLFASMIGKVEESLLVNRVTPALVTLASDIDILVRTATVPCIGTLVTSCSVREVHDKAYMQLQSLLSEPSIKEDHSMACQLVSTLGKITNASEPWFREEVILPQLAYMAEYTTQIANQTRRKDLAIALVNAFSMAIYCPMSKQTIGSCLLPGLRHLESLDIPALNTHYDGINSMIRDAESRLDTALSSPVSTPSVRLERVNSLSQNVNQGVEDMRQRMSKIFQPNVVKTASNLSNLQGMFKKK